MPFNSPLFGFPNFYWHPYYKSSNVHKVQNNLDNKSKCSYNYSQKNSSDSFNEPEEFKKSANYENNTIDFLGLKLQSDDLLILAILFFLYKEDCDDIYLYIALFLLLLS